MGTKNSCKTAAVMGLLLTVHLVELGGKRFSALRRDGQQHKGFRCPQIDLMEVNSALERARLEREQVEGELRQQLAQAEKKAALASSEDFVLFKTISPGPGRSAPRSGAPCGRCP